VGNWVTLVYRIPRQPSAPRVHVWRKLKQLGAIALQDAVWVLPATPRTKEQFQWLAVEITELGGDVTFWASSLLYATDETGLVNQFEEQVNSGYAKILTALKKSKPDVASLALEFQRLQTLDFFQSPLASKVRDALLTKRGGKEK
jgi:hypothetical protein